MTVDLGNGIVNMANQDRYSLSEKGGEKNEVEEVVIFKFFKKIFKNQEMKENIKKTILYKEVKNIFDFLSDLKKSLMIKMIN